MIMEKRKEHVIRMRDGEIVMADTGDQVMDRILNLQKPPHRGTTAKPKANSIGVSSILTELAYVENTDVCTRLKTSSDGLSRAVAEARMIEYGPNAVAMEKQRGWLWRLFKAARNLLVIFLAILATLSFATRHFYGGTGVTLMFIPRLAFRVFP